jgi:hypothetical protein
MTRPGVMSGTALDGWVSFRYSSTEPQPATACFTFTLDPFRVVRGR